MTTTARPPLQTAPRTRRMTIASVTRDQARDPDRIFLYGVEKIGKTTFAAEAPDVVFICSENGLAEIKPAPARFPQITEWQDVLDAVDELTTTDHNFRTLAIDSLDWAAHLLTEEVCKRNRWSRVDFDKFGRGFNIALSDWQKLVVLMERLQAKRGMEIILVAHAEAKRIDPPDQPAYVRYRPKMGGEAAPALLKEWSKSILFARHEMFVEQASEGFGKAKGVSTGARIMHTKWNAAYDAGSRYSLPDPMPLSYTAYADARDSGALDVVKLKAEADRLIGEWCPDEAKEAKVREHLKTCGDDGPKLSRAVDTLRMRAAEAVAERAPATTTDAPSGGS